MPKIIHIPLPNWIIKTLILYNQLSIDFFLCQILMVQLRNRKKISLLYKKRKKIYLNFDFFSKLFISTNFLIQLIILIFLRLIIYIQIKMIQMNLFKSIYNYFWMDYKNFQDETPSTYREMINQDQGQRQTPYQRPTLTSTKRPE